MVLKKLTDAYIRKKGSSLNLQMDFENFIKKESKPYLLIIKSATENYLKITIYPIDKRKITKILIMAKQKAERKVCKTIDILKKYNIIHTGGLMVFKNQIYYECYLNINRETTKKYKELEYNLNQMKNILNFNIEEIVLKKVDEKT